MTFWYGTALRTIRNVPADALKVDREKHEEHNNELKLDTLINSFLECLNLIFFILCYEKEANYSWIVM